MSDRHLRRLGQDYGSAFLALLPQGQAWPKYPGSTLDLACRGLAEYWGFVDSRAADLLERESDPRYTVELLPDWERNWGLPDPCYTEPQNYGERIVALLTRMTMIGGASRQFFIDLAAFLGYTITITEFRTFVVGIDRVGDARVYGAAGAPDPVMRNDWGNPIMDVRGDNYVEEGDLSEFPYYGLGPETNRFYWTVHIDTQRLIWFRVTSGQCGVDPHLRIGLADDLVCLFNRWKPGHTEIIFDYSGMHDPPVITLSASTIPENAAAGAIIGTFDIANYYTGSPSFTLINDAGGRFKIIGNQLQVAVAGVLDYETATSHVIEVFASDLMPIPGSKSFTVTVSNIVSENGIVLLAGATVQENAANGTVVGTLSITNATGTPVFSLVSNPGGKFAISGNNLIVAGAIDFEATPTITVTIGATGTTPTTLNSNFVITVTNIVYENGIILLTGATVPENSANGTVVGTLSIDHATGAPVYSLVSNPGSKFAISGDRIVVAGVTDHEATPTITVTVGATGTTPTTLNSNFVITVTDVLETVTFDPATLANTTLASSNLEVTNHSTIAVGQGARVATASGKNTGKYYFEVVWTAITGGDNNGIGVCTTGSNYTGMGGSATVGTEVYKSSAVKANGTVLVSAMGGTFVVGDLVGVAVNLDTRKIWFRRGATGLWNNDAAQNPATGTGGFTVPAGTMVPVVTFGGTGGKNNNKFTANFGGSSFIGATPSGFTSGWPI